VLYAGVACLMDRIMAIAGKHALVVLEYAAQGVNAFWKREPFGSKRKSR
jgi:dTDP-4-amino-4,6-dideoxygalactose transaminase